MVTSDIKPTSGSKSKLGNKSSGHSDTPSLKEGGRNNITK